MPVNIQVSSTPNENALKFTLDKPALESGHKTYPNAEAAAESPVATALFGIDGVVSVFLMADFITVTKRPDVGWDVIQPAAEGAIQKAYE
ncbi:NifU N-terminal domain-containing protein [Nitrospina watsonii]|uniref:Scaffolding protein n=1 Tax=Nitrospina watsonii TaxID=1323948 RepID=A0ABM9HFM0_9BACT|nr:NifU N-terminal domain-containing protein [Nitrospina watsonii]CAI2719008.1 Scaffolding protein [Nitrospina watsonii]